VSEELFFLYLISQELFASALPAAIAIRSFGRWLSACNSLGNANLLPQQTNSLIACGCLANILLSII
jgi:hypothetical protein